MRITKVSGLVYRQRIHHREAVLLGGTVSRPWHETVLVRVDTDEGLTGWGEAFGHFGVASTTLEALTQIVAPRCAGQDVLDDGLLPGLERTLHLLGASGPVVYALSGLDIALWDLRGKAAGKPVHALIASHAATSLPAYASLIRYHAPEVVASECREALSRGYAAVKLHEVDLAAIGAAAGVLRPTRTPLMVDVNCAWDLSQARAASRAMATFDVRWLEEPIWPPDDHATLAALRDSTSVPVAAGENAASVGDLERLIAGHALDFVQPSVTKLGGIAALCRIAACAARHGVLVTPHSPYFGPGLLATIHVCAALAPGAWIEHLFYDLEEGPFDAGTVPREGRFAVPQAPGLGIEPNLAILENHST
ncbi:mandelate racemase/muconate lactonizing enzyme family protein [Paraburkholderia caballeronis]|uniref:mandelate racemase/muconate lactonizing enzyme family protein n=1 Tax=Paraburkholderia caballeronis TaxID=416943 RepID=UPI001065870B|nr:mandelate racemase/muconate lactonizing enzyme family protein [Paraburkholderia caballeronis]TDV06136.1 L-alanine-DL-glutamate epimerase-like enolase superfamily enzyme [Paraburkholderia caballeronis]TDV09676.1 L-alanine-DL-glutamate epimerase-like enolase superfamily enzyme [Paraburkholderia caballeronis]TDV21741.1 L-alanine-DL-glutamate epimerase-like enolase superfamily enzyme [Paraburkholderia caballeronis]